MDLKIDILVLPSIENISEIVKGINKNIHLTKGYYHNLEHRIQDSQIQLLHKGKDIKEFSTVWLSSFWGLRDLAYAVKLYLDYFHTPHTYVEKTTSKISDQLIFVIKDIRTPNTFFINRRDIADYTDEIEKTCGYPLVIKETKGSRGKYATYIENRKELLREFSKLPNHRKYFFQEFIPNDYDWGILIANGKVVSGEKSFHKNGEFRNNACNGAKEVFVKTKNIPKQICDMAIKASKALSLSWSRSDIIVDKNTDIPYLLEVNRHPGITSGTSEVSGARKFLEMHLSSLG